MGLHVLFSSPKIKYTFFSSAQGPFPRLDHVLKHETHTHKLMKTEKILSFISENNAIHIEISP